MSHDTVDLNISVDGRAVDASKPAVTINGAQISGVRSVKFAAGVGQLTEVTLVFAAHVVGRIEGAVIDATPIDQSND